MADTRGKTVGHFENCLIFVPRVDSFHTVYYRTNPRSHYTGCSVYFISTEYSVFKGRAAPLCVPSCRLPNDPIIPQIATYSHNIGNGQILFSAPLPKWEFDLVKPSQFRRHNSFKEQPANRSIAALCSFHLRFFFADRFVSITVVRYII